MKSKIISTPDFKEFVNKFSANITLGDYTLPEKDIIIDKARQRILGKLTQLKNYDNKHMILANDIATINVKSKISMFNKNSVDLKVGKNYYNDTLEKALIGMKIGETKSIKINDEEVSIYISNIREQVNDDIKLEDVKELNPDVNSVDEYFVDCYKKEMDKFKKHVSDDMTMMCKCKFIEQCNIDIDEEELKEFINKKEDELKEVSTYTEETVINLKKSELIENGKMVDKTHKKMSEDDINKQFIDTNNKLYRFDVCSEYLGEKYNLKLNDDSYTQEIEKIATKLQKTVDDVKKAYTYDEYLKRYSQYALDKLCNPITEKVENLIH